MLRFGTDGVRGVALTELTEQYVADLGYAAATVLSLNHVVIGRDTRESGLVLQTALARGFAAGGATVELLGVTPTPAIAFAAAQRGCAGAAVTASHNSYADNGVKIFGIGGIKLTDDQEQLIEATMAAITPQSSAVPVGAITESIAAINDYRNSIEGLVPSRAFADIRIVVSCRHGPC